MLKLRCTSCSKTLGVKASLGGKQIKCPGCGAVNRVPNPEPELNPEPSETPPIHAAPPTDAAPPIHAAPTDPHRHPRSASLRRRPR
jgi:phage FluMu protein Com